MTRLAVALWATFAGLVFLLAATNTRPRGDSGEYVLMASAFAIHGSPEIRETDVAWVGAREPRLAKLMKRLREGMSTEAPVLLGSIHRSPEGSYFSFHFWFYSLLAAPLLFAAHLVGASPLYGLTLTNAALIVGAVWYASRGLTPTMQAIAAISFLAAGTTYYVAWTGPEVLTAAALLACCFAALRGDFGLALFATGIGASQNPGAMAGALFAGGVFVLRRLGWQSSLGTPKPTPTPRAAALVVLGATFAVLPYLFYQSVFGVPSLIAKYTTDPALASFERLFSLFFDLNQGMIIGVPGVMVGLAVGLPLLARTAFRPRRDGAMLLGVALLTTLLAVAPALSTHNWNSGCGVFMRYAYWASVPLLTAFLELLQRLPRPGTLRVAATAASVQLVGLAIHGFTGDRVWYTRHGAVAQFAMRHFSSLYNPVPEIFLERTLRRESRPDQHPSVRWPSAGTPSKVLVGSGAELVEPSICGGGPFESASVVHVSGGNRYLNGPFRCETAR